MTRAVLMQLLDYITTNAPDVDCQTIRRGPDDFELRAEKGEGGVTATQLRAIEQTFSVTARTNRASFI